MAKTFVFLVSAAAVLCPRLASAQLFESVGIRAQGMGGAFVAVADDASATWWNPAGLATGAFFDALIEYDRSKTPPERSVKGVAVAFPALGLSYYRLPINQMRAGTSTGSAAERRQDQGVLGVYGATVGQSLGAHLVVASTLKLVRAGDTHGDLDLGAMASFGEVRLGLTVKNIRQPSFEGASGSLVLDRAARAGVALVGRSGGLVTDVAVALDADLTKTTTAAGEARHLGSGLELWTFGRKVGLRAGASRNTVGDGGAALSAGLSLMAQSGAYLKTYLDAQVTGGSDEARRGWSIGLRMTF